MNATKRVANLLTFAVAVGSFAAVANAEVIHRYSFKDGAKDSVGKVDGVLKGEGATVADGKLALKNPAIFSDDTKLSYLEFPTPVIPKSGSTTIVAWFTAKETGDFARLLNFGSTSDGQGMAFIYATPRTADGTSRAAISAADTGSKSNVDGNPLDDGQTYMVAVVVDGNAKKLSFYINDKEAAPAVDLGDNTLDKVKPVENWIGKSSFAADSGFNGTIDEFRVYDNALTAADVAATFKAGPEEVAKTAAAAPTTRPQQ